VIAALLLLCVGAPGAEEIVAEFRAIRIPWGLDVSEEEYEALVRERCGRQCSLALELSRRFPEHEAVPELMLARWTMLLTVFDDPARVLSETAAAPERLAAEAALAAAYATLEAPGAPSDEKLKRMREAAALVKTKRHEEYAAFLMASLARDHVASPRKQREICERVVAEWPAAAEDARRHLVALERVGKVLEVPEGRPLVAEAGAGAAAPAAEAEYVIVHFFSAYDGRMGKDLRELREAVKRLPARRVRVEGVLLYDDEGQLERAGRWVREGGMEWPVRVAPEDGPDGWWSRLRLDGASFVLLDRERRVVALAGRPAPLCEALARVGAGPRAPPTDRGGARKRGGEGLAGGAGGQGEPPPGERLWGFGGIWRRGRDSNPRYLVRSMPA
jgi:hypothetical protein